MTPAEATFDTAAFRKVLGRFPTGVTIITAGTSEGPVGMAVNSFASVSLEPPLILFCAAHSSTTWPGIRDAGAFSVNILGRGDEALCRRFAGKDVDRFADVAHRHGATGAPVLDGVAAHLDCRIEALHEAGDHVIVVGRVESIAAEDDVEPLVFHAGAYRWLHIDD
ncbi:MAG: flavin reductase [Nitriliruptorales bacterium]|nr:flavin reductase [Nitriliruptorales bacterium]